MARKAQTTKTTRRPTTSEPADPVRAYAAAVLRGEIVAGPHVRNACRRHIEDLKGGKARGLRWDLPAALRFIHFCRDVLRLAGGQFEGKPFILEPSQAFQAGSIFGWKRADGTRRFRRAFIETGKGSGKSPLIAAVGMYGLVADEEDRAEIYAAGKDKDQAMVLFRDAVSMVQQSPRLSSRLKQSGQPPSVWNLAFLDKGSFFRPISKEGASSGPRPHFALCDELHEHPDGTVIEMLERGFKFRRQPLLAMITNSGTDRNSACWHEHIHAIRAAAGNPNLEDKAGEDFAYLGDTEAAAIYDDSFSYVCALDGARTETLTYSQAMRHMLNVCSCHNVSTTQIEKFQVEAFAANAMRDGGGLRAASDAQNTLSGQSSNLGSATYARARSRSSALQKHALGGEFIKNDGTRKTKIDCENTNENGLQTSLDIDWQNLKSSLLKITGSKGSGSKPSLKSRAGSAQSVGKSQNGFVSTIAMRPEDLEGLFVNPAILESVFSEILAKVWNAHSPICEARNSVLRGQTLSVNFPADDPLEDPACWAKVNPLLGITITDDYLAGVVRQAKAIPGKANNILRLHFCTWTDAERAWMTRATLEPCIQDFDPAQFEGHEICAGADLSGSQDLTAVAYVAKTGEAEMTRERKLDDGSVIVEKVRLPTYHAWVDVWTPGDTLAERALRDQAPYEAWRVQGWLRAPPGRQIRLDFVAARIAEMTASYRVLRLAYDRYAYARLADELDQLGVTVPQIEHPQGGKRRAKLPEQMVEELKEEGIATPEGPWMPGSLAMLETLILERRITIQKNPVMISAFAAAATEEDPFGNRWFSKRKATKRIDPLVALAMAIGAATVEFKPSDVHCVYETKDLLILIPGTPKK